MTGTGAGFTTSSRTAWIVLGGCGVLALLLGLVSTGRWAQTTAARNGERLATQADTALQAR